MSKHRHRWIKSVLRMMSCTAVVRDHIYGRICGRRAVVLCFTGPCEGARCARHRPRKRKERK
mgnify:CR=1 FL=1